MTATAQETTTPSVFVVDDEPDVRMLARVMLERGGLKVVDEPRTGSRHSTDSTS